MKRTVTGHFMQKMSVSKFNWNKNKQLLGRHTCTIKSTISFIACFAYTIFIFAYTVVMAISIYRTEICKRQRRWKNNHKNKFLKWHSKALSWEENSPVKVIMLSWSCSFLGIKLSFNIIKSTTKTLQRLYHQIMCMSSPR